MATDAAPTRFRHDPSVILAAVLALFSVLSLWHYSEQCFGMDFYQFWVVGQEIRKPAPAPIYTDAWRISTGERYWQAAHARSGYRHEIGASDLRRVLQTYSTPLLYSFFSVIDTGNYDQSLKHYQMISFACGIAAIVIVCRLLQFSWTMTAMMVAALFGWGEAYISEVFCVNVNQVQLLAISGLIWIQVRAEWTGLQSAFLPKRFASEAAKRFDPNCNPIADGCTGALLALIVLFKPNVAAIAVLLGLMWLMDRKYAKLVRVASSFAIAATVIVVATSLRIGFSHCWMDWLQSVHQLERQNLIPQGENYSLAAVADARWGSLAARIVSVMAPVVAFAIFAMRRSTRGPQQLVRAISIGAALSLLASPFAWLHYFVLLTPLLLMSLRPCENREPATWHGVRIALGIFSLILICLSPFVNNVLNTFAWRSVRMAGITALLFVFTLLEFWRDSLPAWPGLSFGISLGKIFRRNTNAAS